MTKENIKIFDTTLRDGEQSPGASMNLEEKILIAKTLDAMGVNVIEAGFAKASQGDFKAINIIAKTVKNATICSLSRAIKSDIQAAAEAIAPANNQRIHTFISTSDLHMKHKLQMEPSQVIDKISQSVAYAKSFVDDVEWSAEDATRTNHEFLFKCLKVAIDNGATTVNIPDTVGYTTPDEYAQLIKLIKANVPNIDKAIISVHCHNDLGLAVANSLSAVSQGARQIECTINGLGERAGNAALEEIVMAIKTRNDILPFTTSIDTKQITRVSKLVSTVTGFAVQKNKAIVGSNAFAHESGIHQDGMLKNASTYEIMTPESVGITKSSLVLGKLSGRHAFKNKLEELGINLNEEILEEAFYKFKALADRKKEVYDEDIIALVDDNSLTTNDKIKFISLDVNCGSKGDAVAKINLNVNGENQEVKSAGSGPVDALFKAIKTIINHNAHLELYQVHAVTKGTDAQAEVTVRLSRDNKISTGNGRNTDTLVASAVAYISALNKLLAKNDNKIEGTI